MEEEMDIEEASGGSSAKRPSDEDHDMEPPNKSARIVSTLGPSTRLSLQRNQCGSVAKIDFSKIVLPTAKLYCFGTNFAGQLGSDCYRQQFPMIVQELRDSWIKAVACGGMHTVALDEAGNVWTFGSNDEKQLGRRAEDRECARPGMVQLPKKVKQVTAGDCHSTALTVDGEVYAWGCFQNGERKCLGLCPGDGEICHEVPQLISNLLEVRILKVASGTHHIAMLGEDGNVYTCGIGERGQLGRQRPQTRRVTRSMGHSASGDPPPLEEFWLKPEAVGLARGIKFKDVWAGDYTTYCAGVNNDIYVCGANNYCQLGIEFVQVVELPTKLTSFRGKTWQQIAAGEHHVVALDEYGKVYTLGRSCYGRLGLGTATVALDPNDPNYHEVRLDISVPTEVKGLPKCIQVGVGSSTSYAVTIDGRLYAWGFGVNGQLAQADGLDRNVPVRCMAGQGLEIKGRVIKVDAGGQHVALTISEI